MNKLFTILLSSCLSVFSLSAQERNLLGSVSEIKESILFEGLDLELGYTGDYYSNLAGGMNKNSTYLDNVDIVLNLNLQELLGWQGANLAMYILGNSGGVPSENSGAAQGISNIAAHDTWKIYELWLEQKLFDEKISLLFGLYDLNSEFDSRETSALFINPSHGIGPEFAMTGENGPSIFPTTSLALRLKYNLNNNVDLLAVVMDGVPGDPENPNGTKIRFDKDDGLLIASELIYRSHEDSSVEDYFKLSAGGWYYTTEFEDILDTGGAGDPLLHKGNWGVYLSAEKFLWTESDTSTEGLAFFVRAGIADNNINQFSSYLGAGLIYTGLIPGRDNDILGLAIASAGHSDKFREAEYFSQGHEINKRETILELTYSLNLFESINIQPDLQYILNPSGCHHNKSALTIGTRFQVTL